MKKSIVSLLIGLMMLGVSGNVWAGSVVAADLNCTNPAGCVQTNEISDGAVTEPKLASGAVTSGKIVDGAVSNAKIADGAVTTTKVGDGTITGAKITDGAVTTNKVSDGAITEITLGNAAVTETKLSPNAVSTAKIVDGAVTNNKLADWSVSGSKIVDFSITDTKISSNAVTTGKVADGAITDSKISGTIAGSKLGSHTHNGTDTVDGTITTSKISDGAITDAKITGLISTSKLNIGTTPDTVAAGDHNHDALYQKKYGNVVVVAKSGGDFTSIQAAIDSINPTAENPYLIKVMAGIYDERITMKSYLHIQGAGRDVTTIRAVQNASSTYAILAENCTNITISGFTIMWGGGFTMPGAGIISNSSATIIDNIISGNGTGIAILGGEQPTIIKGNIITGNLVFGITLDSSQNATITGNTITNNGNAGIWNHDSSPIIRDNIITKDGFGGYPSCGILITFRYSTMAPTIIYNKITGNNSWDITWGTSSYSGCAGLPLISFNVYDMMQSGCGVGTYNVKSDGSPAPAP